jgi:hypothetical protein
MSEEFDRLSRKAATETLTPEERRWLELFLRDHPNRRADLDWDQAFAGKLAEKVDAMPAMPGWERTERLLAAPSAIPARAAEPARSPGILDRLSDWLSSALGMTLNVQAIAAALVLVQAGVIGVLAWQYRDVEYSQVRTGTQNDVTRGPLLRVSFKQDVREADLRKALADIGGEIVGGPGQIGVYAVRVKDGDLGAAAERLRAGGLTELVEIYEPKR